MRTAGDSRRTMTRTDSQRNAATKGEETGSNLSPSRSVDLTTCDREPILTPGSIQPHGVLLVIEEPSLRVVQASANVGALLGRDLENVLGHRLGEVLGGPVTAEFHHAMEQQVIKQNALLLRTVKLDVRGEMVSFQAIVHRHDQVVILELEPVVGENVGTFQEIYPLLREFLAQLESSASFEGLARLAAHEVRAITDFDRVLIYRFEEDWCGTVIAESRNDRLPSYMGLRFPATDIPAQGASSIA